MREKKDRNRKRNREKTDQEKTLLQFARLKNQYFLRVRQFNLTLIIFHPPTTYRIDFMCIDMLKEERDHFKSEGLEGINTFIALIEAHCELYDCM